MAEPDKNFKTTKPIVIQTARKSFCILQNSQNSFSQALGSRRRSCILDRRTLPPSTNCTTYGNACSAAFKGTMHAFDWLFLQTELTALFAIYHHEWNSQNRHLCWMMGSQIDCMYNCD